jgi:hypothetical protein
MFWVIAAVTVPRLTSSVTARWPWFGSTAATASWVDEQALEARGQHLCTRIDDTEVAGEDRPHAARSRDERSKKSGRRMAAEKILFSRRWYGDMITTN